MPKIIPAAIAILLVLGACEHKGYYLSDPRFVPMATTMTPQVTGPDAAHWGITGIATPLVHVPMARATTPAVPQQAPRQTSAQPTAATMRTQGQSSTATTTMERRSGHPFSTQAQNAPVPLVAMPAATTARKAPLPSRMKSVGQSAPITVAPVVTVPAAPMGWPLW